MSGMGEGCSLHRFKLDRDFDKPGRPNDASLARWQPS